MHPLTLTLFLLFSAPEGAPATTADLSAKTEAVLETPDAEVMGELERMVAEFEARPEDVIADPALADELLRARVVLAWAHLDPEQAAIAMDEAIRSAAGRALPITGLGSGIKALAKDRAAALEGGGTANIEIDCSVPCQVIVNERRSVNPTDPLVLGTYRVWVVARNDEVEPMRADVVLGTAGQTERLEFAGVEVAPAPEVVEPPPAVAHDDDKKRRRTSRKPPAKKAGTEGYKPLLPLWVEVVGVVAGTGLIATGAALLAIDGQCKDGGDPASCPKLIENTPQGAALVAVGAGALVSFGTVLGVDRARARQNIGAAAMVSWTFRF